MKKTKTLVPLGAYVPAEIKRQLNADGKKFQRSLGSIVTVALRGVFALKPAERELLYKNTPAKILGRPVDS